MHTAGGEKKSLKIMKNQVKTMQGIRSLNCSAASWIAKGSPHARLAFPSEAQIYAGTNQPFLFSRFMMSCSFWLSHHRKRRWKLERTPWKPQPHLSSHKRTWFLPFSAFVPCSGRKAVFPVLLAWFHSFLFVGRTRFPGTFAAGQEEVVVAGHCVPLRFPE